jgi:L-fuconolactonase
MRRVRLPGTEPDGDDPRPVIVDGHAHLWTIDPTTYPWRPTFGFVPTVDATPDVLISLMDRVGVEWAVLVQPSAYGPDHRFLFDAVARHPDRFVAVGLIDPADLDAGESAATLVREGGCVGLRVNLSLDLERATIQADADTWTSLEALSVPVCLRATAAHHDVAMRILRRHPHLRLVIDHLELPDPGDLAGAADRVAELSAFANCWLKVAGLGRFSKLGPPYFDTWPLVAAALRSFGASRLFWGSDHPSERPHTGYIDAAAAIARMPFIAGADRDRLMAGTARELWGRPAGAA